MKCNNGKKIPTGSYKQFGALGPVYQVGKFIEQLDDGDCLVEITIVATNEVTEYSLLKIINDPEAE